MEQKLSSYILADDQLGVVRVVRDLPPVHFTFRIESFSSLLDFQLDCFESRDFEVDGYKWKLCLYPNGNKKGNGDGHISLYLQFSESNKVSLGSQVHTSFTFLLYDQLRDKYLAVHEGVGRIRRFHAMQSKWGIDQVLPLSIFNDASNGFLVDDRCVFGVEIFVIKPDLCKGESLSVEKDISNNTFTWKIHTFKSLTDECYRSDTFRIGQRNWKLLIYPKGESRVKGKKLSLFLEFKDSSSLSSGTKVYAEFILRVKNQVQGKHQERTWDGPFSTRNSAWGFSDFMALTDLTDPSSGYIVNDTLEVEVQLDKLSNIKDFP